MSELDRTAENIIWVVDRYRTCYDRGCTPGTEMVSVAEFLRIVVDAFGVQTDLWYDQSTKPANPLAHTVLKLERLRGAFAVLLGFVDARFGAAGWARIARGSHHFDAIYYVRSRGEINMVMDRISPEFQDPEAVEEFFECKKRVAFFLFNRILYTRIPPHVLRDHIEPRHHVFSVFLWTNPHVSTGGPVDPHWPWFRALHESIDIAWISYMGHISEAPHDRLIKLCNEFIRGGHISLFEHWMISFRSFATMDSALVVYDVLHRVLEEHAADEDQQRLAGLVAMRDLFKPTMTKSAAV